METERLKDIAEALAAAKDREAEEIDPSNPWPIGSPWREMQNEAYRKWRRSRA